MEKLGCGESHNLLKITEQHMAKPIHIPWNLSPDSSKVPLMPAEWITGWMNEWGLSFHLRKNWAFLNQVLCSYLTNVLYLNLTHLYLDHPILRLKIRSVNSISLAPIPTCHWRSLPPTELNWSRSCLILCDPMDYSPPAFSVYGVFQARVLEWVAISFSRGSPQARNRTQVSRIAGRHFIIGVTWGSP